MAKQNDHIKSDGEITQAMGYENFRVRLDNDIEILAVVSGRMRQNHIRLMPGDRVQVEMSPYDLTRGRIVYRYNVKR
jgi:translation initiation factor IF-1